MQRRPARRQGGAPVQVWELQCPESHLHPCPQTGLGPKAEAGSQVFEEKPNNSLLFLIQMTISEYFKNTFKIAYEST